jgi:hypothetical protein
MSSSTMGNYKLFIDTALTPLLAVIRPTFNILFKEDVVAQLSQATREFLNGTRKYGCIIKQISEWVTLPE